MFYPKIMQPTHVKWEQVIPDSSGSSCQVTAGAQSNGHLTNGDAHPDTTMAGDDINIESQSAMDGFRPVPDIISRNFLVTDMYFETPPFSNVGVPGPDGGVSDVGPNGLSDIPQDVLDELPEDCRIALEQAKNAEAQWKNKWNTEKIDGSRGSLRIGFNGFPV